MNIIRRYYLPSFVGFCLFFSFYIFSANSPNSILVNIMICLAGAVVASGITGTFYYMNATRWGPAKRKKILLRSPFTELFQNGFTKQGDIAIGNIQGYTILIHYISLTGKSAIKLDILFDVGFHVYASEDVLKDIINRNPPANRFADLAHEWARHSIGCRFEYYFKPPSYEKLKAKAEEFTAILLREELVPITLDEISQPGRGRKVR